MDFSTELEADLLHYVSEHRVDDLRNLRSADKELFFTFFAHLDGAQNLSKHTLRAYVMDVLEFLVFIQKEDVAMEEVDLSMIRSYFTARVGANFKSKSYDQRMVTGLSKNRKLSPRTQARKLSSIRVFFRFLLNQESVESNPTDGLRGPKFYRSLPGIISQDDLKELFSPSILSKKGPLDHVLYLRDLAIYESLYSTGMRISELLSLTEKLNIQDDTIKILGKGGKERYVFLGEPAREALSKYIEVRSTLKPRTSYLFVSKTGDRLSDRTVRYALVELKRKLALRSKLTPHKFRHSFASDLLNEGADLRSVQEMLGHSSPSTTQVYTHLSKDRLREIHRMCHPHGKKTASPEDV